MELLSLAIFFPVLGVLPVLFIPEGKRKLLWGFGTVWSFLAFGLSLLLLLGFDVARADAFQFEGKLPWIGALGASYHIGIDGMSLLLILLTTLLTALGVLSSFKYIEFKVKEYLVSMLVLETALLGVFSALDLLLFFVFWEAVLIPMFLLIGIWGHGRKLYAAYKFLLYTMAGSVLMLTAMIWLRLSLGSFDYLQLLGRTGSLAPGLAALLFWMLAFAFAIKVPLFPLHTWLPHAHAEAPTAGSVLLAGVLLKMGVYGFLRFGIPLFPEAARAAAPVIAGLALVGIIYGALMTWVQRDLKRLIAYSSVAHLGFIMLGVASLNTVGFQGAIIQMINHGISTGALFFIAGMLYERSHTRDIQAFGGLAKLVPALSVAFGITMLASVGLPGLNGFVGEFLCLAGAFASNKLWAALGVVGIILAAVYLLTMFQKVVFLGPGPASKGPDLTRREALVLAPLLVLMFWIGFYPNSFLRISEPSSRAIASLVEAPPARYAHLGGEK